MVFKFKLNRLGVVAYFGKIRQFNIFLSNINRV